MAGTLESVGYVCAEDASDADVIVYNTCSIRDKAEQKVYSALGKQVSTDHRSEKKVLYTLLCFLTVQIIV